MAKIKVKKIEGDKPEQGTPAYEKAKAAKSKESIERSILKSKQALITQKQEKWQK
jgi:hypothetical protein